MSVPGIRLPCLAGEASATAASRPRVEPRAAEQRHRARRGAVGEHGTAGLRLLFEPAPQRLDVPIGAGVGDGRWHPDSVMPSSSSVARMRCTDSSGSAVSVHGRQQYRPAVQIELPCGGDPHPDLAEQAHQRSQRVVREMSVPQRIPLTLLDDRRDASGTAAAARRPGGDLGASRRTRSAGPARA